MAIMLAAGKIVKQPNLARLCQGSESCIVGTAQLSPPSGDLIRHLQLRPQVRSLDLAHDKIGANVHPLVAADLATKKLPAVSTIVVDNFGAGKEFRVVDDDGAALASGGEVLGFVEAEAAHVADGAEGFVFVGRCQGRRGVLHDDEVVFFCYRHDGVHVACYASVVNRDDDARFGSDGRFDLGVVYVHVVRFDVHHDGDCSAEDESIDARNKGEAGQDHLLARLYVGQDCGKLQGGSARGGHEDWAPTHQILDVFLATLGEGPISAEVGGFCRYCDVALFRADERSSVEWYHVGLSEVQCESNSDADRNL